ncbi:MAG: Fur family transcriptional regulator [Bacteroidetes bacterium]|nr:Fur family transcriptional regulator [Bacteroidota bacterium]MCY4205743.1 Fur family transcriptional regulator [Bacteroidota bacterium]
MAKFSASQQKEVRERFREFLKLRGLRETRERIVILDAIYQTDDHIDADTLHLRLRQQNHEISRATVYNTLNLLLECQLVTRHQFGSLQAQYEPSFLFGQHDHLVCLDCKEVMEFCDPRIQSIQEMVADVYSFKIKRHTLNLYGHCTRADCINRSTKDVTA